MPEERHNNKETIGARLKRIAGQRRAFKERVASLRAKRGERRKEERQEEEK